MNLSQTLVNGIQVSHDQFQIDRIDIFNWINLTRDTGDVRIVKCPHDMDDRIGLANVFQKLVTQTFTLRGTLDDPGNVGELKRGWHDLFGGNQFLNPFQALVWHFHHPHVGFNRGKWVVGHFGTSLGNSVKQRGLADVWQSHDTCS